MAWKFWKDDNERFEEEMKKAFDNRNKNKVDKAVENFLSAYKIASSSDDPGLREKGKIAYAYALIYTALLTKKPADLDKAYSYLKSLPRGIEFDLALPRPIRSEELAEELHVLSLYYSAPVIDLKSVSSISPDDARRIKEMGEYFLSKGSQRLLVEDLVGLKEPLNIIGLRLLGYSRLIEAAHAEGEDLSKAINLYAEALAYFHQIADQFTELVKVKIDKLGKATKCWICGRSIQGEEVNFVYLDSFLTKYIVERYSKDAPGIIETNTMKIATCSACYGAIYKLSDKIAKYYYEEAIRALRALEEKVITMISQLQAQISMLQSRVSSLEAAVSSLRSSVIFRR